MLKINDKIKYVKRNPLWVNFPIGTVMTITDIAGTTVAGVADYKVNNDVVGQINVVMSYDEFEKWFERVNDNIEKSEPKSVWSGWKPINNAYALWYVRNIHREHKSNMYLQYLCNEYLTSADTNIWYRIKGNQVQVMFKLDNGSSVVSNAKCNTKGGDVFDINKGIGLGILRCFIKTMIKDLDEIIHTL